MRKRIIVFFLSVSFLFINSTSIQSQSSYNVNNHEIILTEVEKFEDASLLISKQIASNQISYKIILDLLSEINIAGFNYETGSEYRSIDDLASQVYQEIELSKSTRSNFDTQTRSLYYEGGLNLGVEGWNFYGQYLSKAKADEFHYKLTLWLNHLTFGTATGTIVAALFGPVGSAAVAVVGGWNIKLVSNALASIQYYNSNLGIYVTRNKFTNSYYVRAQVQGNLANGWLFTGGCAGCAFGGGGGGGWRYINSLIN